MDDREPDINEPEPGFGFLVRLHGPLSHMCAFIPCRVEELTHEDHGPWRKVLIKIEGRGRYFCCIGELSDADYNHVTVKQVMAASAEYRAWMERNGARRER